MITLEALSEELNPDLTVLCHRFSNLRNETNMNNIRECLSQKDTLKLLIAKLNQQRSFNAFLNFEFNF